ncbi:hypothetical protein J6590_013733 [Homalodisca vitripennis]|nr:hypothetical protein J6590_013733 [Homalodisca vitripennis]
MSERGEVTKVRIILLISLSRRIHHSKLFNKRDDVFAELGDLMSCQMSERGEVAKVRIILLISLSRRIHHSKPSTKYDNSTRLSNLSREMMYSRSWEI